MAWVVATACVMRLFMAGRWFNGLYIVVVLYVEDL